MIAAAGLGLLFTLLRGEAQDPRRGRDEASPLLVAGLSDEVTLGGFGRIKSSDRVALEVRIAHLDGERPIPWTHEDGERADLPPMLLRAFVQDHWDGLGFSRSPVIQDPWRTRQRWPQGLSLLTVRQTISFKPTVGRTLVGMNHVDRVQGDGHRDLAGCVVASRAREEALRYVVSSRVLAPASRGLLGPYPARHPDGRYLQLPRAAPALRKLAEGLVIDAPRDLDRVLRIERWLRDEGGFVYTRNNPNAGEDPLSRFLFETRAGHCEYFAAAMVVMLRSAGLPARLATGFRGGTYDDRKALYRVLENRAHAWVEVPFDGVGWVAFDPTPAETRLDVAAGGTVEAGGRGGERRGARRPEPRRDDPSRGRTIPWELVAGAGLLLLVIGAVLVGVGRGRRRTPRDPSRPAGGLLRRLLAVLREGGARPRSTATLRELAAEASLPSPGARAAVDEVIDLLYRSWYGGAPAPASAVRDAQRRLRAVEAELEAARRPAPVGAGEAG